MQICAKSTVQQGLAIALMLSISPRLWGIEEVFHAELVYPQERGELQLSLVPSLRSQGGERNTVTTLAVEYGLTEQWQVEVAWDSSGEVEIGSKYAWMQLRPNLHMAAAFDLRYPLNDLDSDFSEGFIEYEPSLLLARDFPRLGNLQLFLQTGIGLVERAGHHRELNDDEPAANEFSLDIGLFVPRQSFTWTTEISWSNNRWNRGGEENQLLLTPGLVWRFADAVEISFGIPIGLNSDSDDYRLVGQFILEWGD